MNTQHGKYMKSLVAAAVIVIVTTGFAICAEANLVDAGIISPNSDDPAGLAAALQIQYHTGALMFLGGYVNDFSTGEYVFVPGAITSSSQISYLPGSANVSWDLAGTNFRNRFVVAQFFGDDFAFDEAYRVTPDEFGNSFGPQPSGQAIGGPSTTFIYFFGMRANVPETGGTWLLLASGLASLQLLRRGVERPPYLKRARPGKQVHETESIFC